MHAKTDSEVTSLAPSSPARSPPRAANNNPNSGGGGGVMRGSVYYVQSPSRDSHDGETTTKGATSVHSTPALSPMASPRHSHSSVGRDSSSSRFSRGGAHHKDKSAGRKGAPPGKGWQEIGVIEEEGLLDEEDQRRPMPKRCKYCLIFVGGFAVLFTFFALVLWGASRSQKPQIEKQSITFENFIIQAGTDASLVPTDMATTNATVKFTYKNTGTFFGIHVTADPFTLSYSQLNLAAGDLKKFYQGRSGRRTASVNVKGNKVPLYGSGPTLMAQPAGGKGGAGKVIPVPMVLRTTVRSQAYVLGALVKPRFTKEVECKVVMNPAKLNKPVSLEKACKYS
ncbi:unnamed protein product [Triticum turgidum subsp. durum]|uniref:Late embryogenesis abundant protein LEA-2 subgroup domain-containing protein n=1 Tax=Triticum turgidum subsp. durum TaxID=4567 RepID=A0A9R1RFC1_TRITD|nr:unnamed protein product [Triticum turgidum subsp. durum]